MVPLGVLACNKAPDTSIRCFDTHRTVSLPVADVRVEQKVLVAQLRSTVTSYAAIAAEHMRTATWNASARLPDPLQQHVPPVAGFIEALESTLLAVSGLCRDWVQQLADLELKARQREVIQNGGIHERGPRDGAPSYSEGDIGPTGFKSVGGEDAVQLAVGFLFRILADANLTTQAWRDTSRSGVAGQKAKPDFSSFIYLPQLWHSMVSSCTRDYLATL